MIPAPDVSTAAMTDGDGELPRLPEAVICDDGLGRCFWASSNPVSRDYHDREWGLPVRGERALFERITLEAFQSGLSWLTILNKRPAFRVAFHDFDPDAVAALTDADVDRLMADAGIVRNRRKIEATRANARATVHLRADGGLDALVWSFAPRTTPAPRTAADVPTRSAESLALSAELRRRGFAHVGPTTMFALMEAIGMVDTHLLGCHRRGSSGLWTVDGTTAS
jgi:DNA-3-methyladenine glycosylase I